MITNKKMKEILAEERQNSRISEMQGDIWELETKIEALEERVKDLEKK